MISKSDHSTESQRAVLSCGLSNVVELVVLIFASYGLLSCADRVIDLIIIKSKLFRICQVPAALLLSHNKYNNKHENNEHKKSELETENESNKIDAATSKY